MGEVRLGVVEEGSVAADFVNRQMTDSRAQRIALFLDCCYGGAFPRGMVVRAAGEAQVRDAFAGQADVGGGHGRVVVTASSAMEYAFEGGQLATDASAPTPSVFTSAVVDGLTTGEADRDGDGWVGLTELVGYVTDRVHRVTPNQNPQMWTFGSQGELLIARSRVRRITPAPLAPELLEAIESPLPAARFGVVDYLRGRLYDEDLGQAYGAWKALHRMIDDDSRRVSEAANQAIAEAVPHVTPTEVELGGDGAELHLEGPPIALTAVASPAADWIRVAQDGPTIRISAESPGPGVHEASVIVAGPTGECTIPVRLTMPDTESEPPPPPPEPEPSPKPEPLPTPEPDPATQAEPAPAQPEPTGAPLLTPPPVVIRTEVPERSSAIAPPTAPWWLIGVLVVGAVILIYLNWPGTEGSRYIWKDADNTGWYVYRSWSDPVIVASFGASLASLVARWSGPIALGIVAGCAASVIEYGLLILGGGISYIETNYWLGTLAVAGVLAVVLLIVMWPGRWPLRPAVPSAAAVVVAGGILLLISALITHPSDGLAFYDVTKLALLEPVATVALAWLALAANQARTGTWLTAATATYALIKIVATVPELTEGGSLPAFLTAMFGNLLVVAGVLTPVLRPLSRP